MRFLGIYLYLFLSFSHHSSFSAAQAFPGSVLFYVEGDFFHTYLILPDTGAYTWKRYEYAEASYYLKGDHSVSNTFKVLFLSTPATVGEYRYASLPLAERPRSERFSFLADSAGFSDLRRFVESWITRSDTLDGAGSPVFYASPVPYTWANNCHHFVLKALQAGGIPVAAGRHGISDFWARRELRSQCVADTLVSAK